MLWRNQSRKTRATFSPHKEKTFIKHYDTIYRDKMPRLTSQLKSLTEEELTRIRLQIILKMLEIDPKLKRILKLYLHEQR